MFILAGIAALVWWEIILVVLLGLFLIVGTQWDRASARSGPMWIAALAVVVIATVSMGFTPALDMVMSAEFWKNVALYLGIGLVYSWAVEFLFAVRRSSRFYRERWASAVQGDKNLRAYLYNPEGCSDEVKSAAAAETRRFHDRTNTKSRLIGIDLSADHLSVTPRVNRRVLVDSVSAWTLLWPAYAISLIVGDLFSQVIKFVVDVSTKLSGAAVRLAFQNTFKL